MCLNKQINTSVLPLVFLCYYHVALFLGSDPQGILFWWIQPKSGLTAADAPAGLGAETALLELDASVFAAPTPTEGLQNHGH